ncbi:E3 ubiquitin/ISG15 ligase TRIM25-like [Trichomycterus rosablanca]|uniref:E3 ubiquitin/ISG15 ligase TRIM25-like n=1 Tax=Trichomycterus rosablanca TaxID=2290929 RepID=UPI002F34F652
MSEAFIPVDQLSVDQFSCPVCLDLLKDPVATPCGHSFCKVCINGCWDQEDGGGIFSCPQCRKTFSPRPDLCRNTMLAEVVEKLKKTKLQTASSAHRYTKPGDVECDLCSGTKHKAVKSCLMCLASFCETHLKPHYEVPAWKKHTLVEACGDLQEKICSQHDKPIESYCRTDRSFICSLCLKDQHKGHNTVPVQTERSEKQNKLKDEQRKSQQRIQEKQKKLQELQNTVSIIKGRAEAAVENNEKIFTELISFMEKKCSEMKKLIRDQEEAELSLAEQLIQQLEQEITELMRRVDELEELSQSHDHIHFLQNKLKDEQRKSQQRIQEKQKKLQELQNTVSIIKGRAEVAVQNNEKIFTKLISFMENKCSEVTKLIRDQEEAELSLAEQLIQQLEQEITELMRRVDELEELSQSHDHIHFLQSFPSLCVSSGCEDSSSITVNQHLSFDGVNKSLSDLKKRIMEFCDKKIQSHAAAEPKSREDHLQYFCELSLDPNTSHGKLILSEKKKLVRVGDKDQRYPDHPERFSSLLQVLSQEKVSGRCYWEVEWSGGEVFISVSYKEIDRKGRDSECWFGYNEQSWSLECSSSSLCFWHNNVGTELEGPPASRIGVYVDHSAGTLSFYSISDTMRLLHRVQTTFTQPLYAGFRVGSGSTVGFCDAK